MTVEFECEGCGVHVYSFGVAAVPNHGFCSSCAWLCEWVPDPKEMMEVRKRLDPGEPEMPGKRRGRQG